MVRCNVVFLAKRRQDRLTSKEQKVRIYKVFKEEYQKEVREVKKAEREMEAKKKIRVRQAEVAEEAEAGGKEEKLAMRKSKRSSLFDEAGEDERMNMYEDEFKFNYKPPPKRPPSWWKSAYGVLPQAGEYADMGNVDGVFRMASEGQIDTRVPFLYQHFLQKCTNARALEIGQKVHAHIVRNGFSKDRSFNNMLIEMYGACGRIEDAVKVFTNIADKNEVSYGAMIGAYTLHGDFRKALDIYQRMEFVEPDDQVFATALTAAGSLKSLDEGKAIHKRMLDSGVRMTLVLENALISMYCKCGDMGTAANMFNGMAVKNSTTWSIIISGYIHSGDLEEAIKLYKRIQHGVFKIQLNTSTLVLLLGACADLDFLEEGREIHDSLQGRRLNASLASALMNFYSKCNRVDEAWGLFDQLENKGIVEWNTMIAAYARAGDFQKACHLYHKLVETLKPDRVTLITMLGVFGELGDLQRGMGIKSLLDRIPGLSLDLPLRNALLDFYGKCGAVEVAEKTFSSMFEKNAETWTAMINGYTLGGYPLKAIELFKQMDLPPTSSSYASAIRACAIAGNLAEGKAVDEKVATTEFKDDLRVQNELVGMYARCGHLTYAKWEFDRIPMRNTASWNAILGGYVSHGHSSLALEMLPGMQQAGVELDDVSFHVMLRACSCVKGLVDPGWELFISMVSDFWIVPGLEHYGCMIDLLGREGKIGVAEELVKTMPYEPQREQWSSLLESCKLHGDGAAAGRCSYHLMEFSEQQAAA